MDTINKALEVFSFATIQSVSQIRNKLKEKRISWKDFDEWVNERIKSGDIVNRVEPMPEKLRRKLEKEGITWKMLLKAVEKIKEERGKRLAIDRRCPECKPDNPKQKPPPLRVNKVNHIPSMMVGDDWNTQWSCPICGWEEFSKKPIEEEIKPYLVEIK